tara:strand:+ start:503 stop:748 length:246 start_codon:yes stop_codon:yes gene_type:complete
MGVRVEWFGSWAHRANHGRREPALVLRVRPRASLAERFDRISAPMVGGKQQWEILALVLVVGVCTVLDERFDDLDCGALFR